MAKIFDIHIYYGQSLFGKSIDRQQLQHWQTLYPSFGGTLIPAKPYDYHYPPINEKIANLTKDSTDWFQTLRVDPWRREEAVKLIQSTSAKILFLHPFEEQIYPTQQNFYEIIAAAEEKKLVVMVACGYLPFSHSSEIFPVIKDFPKISFILTHGAQINISGMHMVEAFEIFSSCENTFFETSGIYREDYIEQAVDELGTDRVLFGSGSPYYHLPYEIKRIEHLKYNNDIKEKIFYHNAIKLLR